jgi:hypothetical protein
MRARDARGGPGARELSMAEQHELLSRQVSRRAVLRGGAIGLGAAMLGPSVLSCSTKRPTTRTQLDTAPPPNSDVIFGYRGSPGGRHLSFGPDPTTQMRVAWQVASPVARPFIRVGSVDGSLSEPIPAELRSLPTRFPGAPTTYNQYYVHAELNGLSPGTEYVYAVGHPGFSDAEWLKASAATFRTAPSITHTASPFVFTAFGDHGTNHHGATSMALVAAQRPAFHLLAGDISYADGTGRGRPPATAASEDFDLFQPVLWDRYLAAIDDVASTVPWMIAAGNHDMEPIYSPDGYGGLQHRFPLPGNGPANCPAVYSFVYGNVGVVSLDANDVSYQIGANTGYSRGLQNAWLRKELASLRKNARVDFIVVFFHHCAFCTASTHGSDGGVRVEWVPLFDEYQVDLVINGHNHIYERTDPLRGGAAVTEAPPGSTVSPKTDGTTYVTAGAGGRNVEEFPVEDSFAGRETQVDQIRTQYWDGAQSLTHQNVGWSRTRFSGFSVVSVEVKPAPAGQLSSMTVKALAQNGREVDRVELRRIAGRS